MATKTTTAEPGPKPDFLVVEDHLKCQTGEGEISLDLRIPLTRLELFMDMEDVDQKKIPLYLRENILWPEDREKIENMRDGAQAFKMLLRFAQAVGERMGASLGESSPSMPSPDSIEAPSDTTSGTASA